MTLTDEQQAQTVANMDVALGLAWKMCKPWFRRRWWNEIKGAASQALCTAVATHEQAAGRKLGAWIYLKVHGAVIDEMRKIERYERVPRLLAKVNNDWSFDGRFSFFIGYRTN